MIALTGCIGKSYNLILAKRLTDFLTANNLIDSSMQKAFLPGINGCIDHNAVMEEVIKQARVNKKPLHGTFFFTSKMLLGVYPTLSFLRP